MFCDGACVEKIAIDLAVQRFAVGDDHKAVVTGQLAEDFARIEDHGEAFARALRVPEDAQFAFGLIIRCTLLPLLEKRDRLVDADKLMVLCDDLLGLFVIEHKVFHIVEQARRGTEPIERALNADACRGNRCAVDLFGFVIGAQPVKKVCPGCGKAADVRLQPVGEQAEDIGMKELGNVLFVVGQVVVKGAFELDIRVL